MLFEAVHSQVALNGVMIVRDGLLILLWRCHSVAGIADWPALEGHTEDSHPRSTKLANVACVAREHWTRGRPR